MHLGHALVTVHAEVTGSGGYWYLNSKPSTLAARSVTWPPASRA